MRLDNFPLYAERMMGSLSLKALSPLAFTCYTKILYTSFLQNQQCYIENDDVILAKVCNVTAEDWASVKEKVLAEYVVTSDGQFIYDAILLSIYNTEKSKKKREQTLKALSNLNYPFEQFWNDYDKKVGSLERLTKKWVKLTDDERELIRVYIPKYKKAKPDKMFRKDPSTFLNNKSWNDEIIFNKGHKIDTADHGEGAGL